MFKYTKTEKAMLIWLLSQENHSTRDSITQISIKIDKSLVSGYNASARLQDLGLIERKQIVYRNDKGNLRRRQVLALTDKGVEVATWL